MRSFYSPMNGSVPWPREMHDCRRPVCKLGLAGVMMLAIGAQKTQSLTQEGRSGLAIVGSSAELSANHPMTVPLRLISEARQIYAGIHDYTCLFVKKERIQGRLQPENLVAMKIRTHPFSVYLRWLKPVEMAGQEACYVTGRNEGMMRVHSAGLLGVVGFVSIDPKDPRALEHSRHSITEAGIGNLLERFGSRWEMEKQWNATNVTTGEYTYNKRRCVRVETVHPANPGQRYLFYRSVLYFDKEVHLPIRIENYDWPHQGGDPRGDLAESYSYADLKLNVKLPDVVFTH